MSMCGESNYLWRNSGNMIMLKLLYDRQNDDTCHNGDGYDLIGASLAKAMVAYSISVVAFLVSVSCIIVLRSDERNIWLECMYMSHDVGM